MHEPVKLLIEEYLAGSDSLPGEFHAHLRACAECRAELTDYELQAAMLRLLRPAAALEPPPGFYARVVDRIDSQRQSSIWTSFLESAFGMRLAVASGVLALLMGLYLVGSEPSGYPAGFARTGAEHTIILPGEDEVAPVLGMGPEHDRGAILANLAAYQE